MAGEVERLQRDIRSARQAIRRAGRTLSQLQAAGRELGRYQLPAGEPIDDREIGDFLRLAVGDSQQEVVLVVSQPAPGPDNPEGDPDG